MQGSQIMMNKCQTTADQVKTRQAIKMPICLLLKENISPVAHKRMLRSVLVGLMGLFGGMIEEGQV